METEANYFGDQCKAQAARESSQSIIQRRLQESRSRAELYTWLQHALSSYPISKDAEEQLWAMLIRERPY